MNRVTLFPHGGSGNHGCEAIIRSTALLLDSDMILFSDSPKEDNLYGIDKICSVFPARKKINILSIRYWLSWIRYHILNDKDSFDKLIFRGIIRSTKSSICALSIGGDNYCYGAPRHLFIIDDEIKKIGIPLILWGCSIEPVFIKDDVLEDLKRFSFIFARESITYQALKNHGFSNVSLFPDPAFWLERIDVDLPDGFIEGNTVGINISPMIIKNETIGGITKENYRTLIHYIIESTQMQIALIPHVVWPKNDDRGPLNELFEEFKGTGRVVLIKDHNAMELKGVIARCRFMIAARTHASIAAYSSQVPTLVLGYSVKALGIAKDLFGDYKHYVLSVQSLMEPDQLLSAFIWMLDNEDNIRDHYRNIMPDYIGRLGSIKSLLEGIIEAC